MTHRKNIVGIPAAKNLRDAIAFMVDKTYSRFPVYDESIDNIIGVLHLKDAMKFHTMDRYDDWQIRDIPDLIMAPSYIPETRGINDLFRAMQARKIQMVIVVDEYGQTAGLVTMEDILEEIVGSIQDEYDNEVPLIQQDANGSYRMDGMATLEEVSQTLDIALEDEEYDTLNGLLISRLDRIPADGEQAEVIIYGYRFQILKVEDKMIRQVRITKYKEEEKE
jgi:putative hemolysin